MYGQHACCRRWRCRSDGRRHGVRASAASSRVPQLLPQWTDSPLHVAVHQGDTASVMSLIRAGTDVDTVTLDGETPLMMACWIGRADVAQVLCELHANLEARDQFGNRPIHRGARHAEIVGLLLQGGVRVDTANRDGDLPLHSAAWGGNTRAMRLLLDHRAHVDAAGHRGATALAVAALRDDVGATRFLIEKGGAAVGATDALGRSALQVAAEAGRNEVAKCLLFHRAEPTALVAEYLHESAKSSSHEAAPDARALAKALGLSSAWAERVRTYITCTTLVHMHMHRHHHTALGLSSACTQTPAAIGNATLIMTLSTILSLSLAPTQVRKFPPLTSKLLVCGAEPSTINAKLLLLEQTRGKAQRVKLSP